MSPPVAVLALLLAAAEAPAAPAPGAAPALTIGPRPRLAAVRVTEAPKIDGQLDDPAWRSAPLTDAFTQHFPNEGAPPTERTSVRVLYDDLNLYVGIDCEQRRSPIVRRLMRRDGQLPSDGVWIDIDSRRGGVGAFHFSINAAGVLSDGIHFNDTEYSADWDAVWEGKVATRADGYSAEMRIPLSAIRFTALPVQDWGFQVRRFIDARQEHDDWAFYPRSASSYVPFFGRLENLVGLEPRRRLELRPFVLGRVEHRAPGADATLTSGWDAGASAGLDAKGHVTNELTLDLAVNPDFGQVEADTVILNLSTFETFFPEKRPFFLEGIDTFAAIRPIVYTRRIGRRPNLPVLGTGETVVDNPQPSPIWTAAKLSGTIGGKTTVGLIAALTGPRNVDVQTSTGLRERRLVEPWTAYSVARLKRIVAPNTEVGVLATAVNRFESPIPVGGLCPLTNAAPAADGRCSNDAYVVTSDGRWRSPSGDYGAAWQAVATRLEQGPARAQRDGIPIEPGRFGGGASVYFGKDGGKNWVWNGWQYLSGRQLEFNDVGYLERKNDYQGYFTLAFRTLEPWWRTVDTRTSLQLNVRQSLDGLPLWRELRLAGATNLSSFWYFYANVHLRDTYYDDREVGDRDGTALQHAARAGVSGEVSSDPRRRVTAWLSFTVDARRGGGWLVGANGRLTFRVLPQLELDLLPSGGYDSGAPRYVASEAPAAGTTTLYFGRQAAANIGSTLRASYTFTPELSLQLYTQLFLTQVRYGPFFTFQHQEGQRERVTLASLTPSGPPPTSPDTVTATLNVNVVFRWEYRLGSTLFLVYTRAQNPGLSPTPDGGFEIRPIFQGRAAIDVLMLKLAYWWG